MTQTLCLNSGLKERSAERKRPSKGAEARLQGKFSSHAAVPERNTTKGRAQKSVVSRYLDAENQKETMDNNTENAGNAR
jgi:hypothetical protein